MNYYEKRAVTTREPERHASNSKHTVRSKYQKLYISISPIDEKGDFGMSMFHKANRRKAKARILLKGPSWGGKTTSALLMAYGMTVTDDGKGGHSWDRIAGIDTENSRMEMKAGMKFGETTIESFPVCQLERPFSVEKYIQAIAEAEKMKDIDVIIIDSASHEWVGGGGILDQKDRMSATSENKMSPWTVLTPAHNRFVDAITSSPKHIIVTVRTKHGVAMVVDESSKVKVQKVPLDTMMRDGFEFEFSWVFSMVGGSAMTEKDDSGMFPVDTGFVPGPESGEAIISWLNQGIDEPMPESKINLDSKSTLCSCGSRASLEDTEDVCGKQVGIYRCMSENKLFRKEVTKL